MVLYLPVSRSSSTISSRKFRDFSSSFLISFILRIYEIAGRQTNSASPFPEQQTAYSHNVAALADGGPVIPAQAHGKQEMLIRRGLCLSEVFIENRFQSSD